MTATMEGASSRVRVAALLLIGALAAYLLLPLSGGLLLTAYAAVFVAAGHLLVARRDVT